MKKCRDWDYEISPCKYLAVWRPLPLASLEHTVSPFPQWIHPRGCWKLAAAAAHSSIATGHLANVLTVLTVSQPAQSLICVWLSMTQWTTACQASLSISNSWSSLRLMSIGVLDAIQPSHPLCHPLFLLPPISPSIRVFSNESTLHIRWPKYWSFSLSISPSNEHPELISFRMDWLDLLAVQGTLKSLLQHHSSKASILRCSAFITVQLSHPYMTTGKTIALTRRTFVGKVMSLLLNMLSRLS